MPPALDSLSKPSKPACTDSAMFLSSAAKADTRLEDSKKPPLTFLSKPSKPACTDSAMFLCSAAKEDTRLEDSKRVPKPFESLEDLKPASCSPSSQLIHGGTVTWVCH